ncbi:MAG: AIR synthase-related protein [Planctomycetaceae bacterium]
MTACHDVADGGLLVALAEMCIGGSVGCRVDLSAVPFTACTAAAFLEEPGRMRADWVASFSETPGRFVCEVPPEKAPAFEDRFAGIAHAVLGEVTHDGRFVVIGRADDRSECGMAVTELETAWRSLSRDFSGDGP